MVKRAISTLMLIVAVAIVGFAVWLAAFAPYKLYIVHTGSMVPTEPVRSLEVVHVGHYHVGQVVSYRFNGETITHRLLGINAQGDITTKGDANRTADPWKPPKSDIIGGVVLTIPMAGWLLIYIEHPLGIVSLILLCLLCWMVYTWDAPSEPPTAEVSSS